MTRAHVEDVAGGLLFVVAAGLLAVVLGLLA